MNAISTWVIVAGVIGGLSSIFIWIVGGIIWLIKYFRKPQLVISDKPEVNKWTFSQSTTWNFAYLLVRSKNGLASLCEAKVIVTEHPPAIQLPTELIEGG